MDPTRDSLYVFTTSHSFLPAMSSFTLQILTPGENYSEDKTPKRELHIYVQNNDKMKYQINAHDTCIGPKRSIVLCFCPSPAAPKTNIPNFISCSLIPWKICTLQNTLAFSSWCQRLPNGLPRVQQKHCYITSTASSKTQREPNSHL